MTLLKAVCLSCAFQLCATNVVSESAGASPPPTPARPARPAAPALVQFINQTDTPILVDLDGAFKGWCQPSGMLTVGDPASGEHLVMGRFWCDRWGPKIIQLERGKLVRHVFTEAGRVTKK